PGAQSARPAASWSPALAGTPGARRLGWPAGLSWSARPERRGDPLGGVEEPGNELGDEPLQRHAAGVRRAVERGDGAGAPVADRRGDGANAVLELLVDQRPPAPPGLVEDLPQPARIGHRPPRDRSQRRRVEGGVALGGAGGGEG